jgi:hypothetical protein
VGFSDLRGRCRHPGRRRHGQRWPVVGRRCWGPTFPGLSAGEGFGCLMLCPMQVGGGLWWLATSADLVLMCEPISWPKCSRGSPTCSTVSVLVGDCCGLLPSVNAPLKIWSLLVGVGSPARWARCRDSRSIDRRCG